MYVIVNNTNDTLLIAQDNFTERPLLIEKNKRQPFFWQNYLSPKNVKLLIQKKEFYGDARFEMLAKLQQKHQEENTYEWSDTFPLNTLGTLSLRVNKKNQRNSWGSKVYEILKV